MSDVLIRDIDPDLSRRIKESAQRNQHSLSDEIKDLIRRNGGSWVAELMPDGSVATQDAGMTINTRYMIQGEPFPNGSDEYST